MEETLEANNTLATPLRSYWEAWVDCDRADVEYNWRIVQLMIMTMHNSDFNVSNTCKCFFELWPTLLSILQASNTQNKKKHLLNEMAKVIGGIYNRDKARYIIDGAWTLAERWWKRNGDGQDFQPVFVTEIDVVPNDPDAIGAIKGCGTKIVAMVMWACFCHLCGPAIDRHVRRYNICNGDAMAHSSEKDFLRHVSMSYRRSDWIRLNYLTAVVAQMLQSSSLSKEGKIHLRDALYSMAAKHNKLEKMRSFLQFYINP